MRIASCAGEQMLSFTSQLGLTPVAGARICAWSRLVADEQRQVRRSIGLNRLNEVQLGSIETFTREP